MTDLLPCPFCGNKVDDIGRAWMGWVVGCIDCDIEIHGATEAEATAHWNTRSQPVCEWECVGISGLAINAPAGTKLYAIKESSDED